MAGNNLAVPGQPIPHVNLGSIGAEIETETQLRVFGATGSYNGEKVQNASFAGNKALTDAADAMEAGLATLVNASRLLAGRRGIDPKRQVVGRQGADDSSATADGDTPDEVVKRLAAFLELSRETGGGGGGAGGGGQGGQQRQALIDARYGSESKKTDALVNALQAIPAEALQGQALEQAIRDALAAFDKDPEQQLLALAGIRIALNAGGDFADALGRVQDEFTSGISGDRMQKVVSNAAIALHLFKLKQREQAGAAGSLRESMSHEARNVDLNRMSGGLNALLANLKKETAPHELLDVFKSQMEAVGRELGLHESAGMDPAHLKAMLTDIKVFNLLNSLYDVTAELIHNSGVEENEEFNIKSAMSFTLDFLSTPAPDESTAVNALNDFFSQAIPPVGRAPLAVSAPAIAA